LLDILDSTCNNQYWQKYCRLILIVSKGRRHALGRLFWAASSWFVADGLR
jgi:hypothetical protein